MADMSRETVKHLSQLCRINCSEEEISSLLTDLQRVLAYIEQLNEIETDNVPPCNLVLEDVYNVMREDEPESSMGRDFFLANSPSHVNGVIRVPPVIKKSQ